MFNNVIDCILFKSLCCFIFSFIFTIVGIKYLISFLKKHKAFQPIRIEGPEGHLINKQKTPTMGGLICALSFLTSSLLFCDLSNIYVIATITISTVFAIIGLIDDIIKVFYQDTKGFRGSIKLLLQVLVCGLVSLWLLYNNSQVFLEQSVFIPFFKISIYISFLFIPYAIFVIVGSTNGVNLTDGLDGLATIPALICAFALGLLTLANYSDYNIFLIKNLNNDQIYSLFALCLAVIGTGLAFFIYNKHPAKIFMGDVGSYFYGGFLGSVAIFTRYEIFFAIVGSIFVMESLSVIIQVASFKIFKKRIFKMAPLHHHFEKLGWTENKVVLTFWFFTFLCFIIGLLGIINF